MKSLIPILCLLCSITLLAQTDSTETSGNANIDFSIVEIMPSYPGGNEGMFAFIDKNIKYPLLAKEKNIEGKVTISFVVEADGTLTNIEIKNDIGGGCGKEGKRVVEMMPKWNPGFQKGQYVRTSMNLALKKDSKKKKRRRK